MLLQQRPLRLLMLPAGATAQLVPALLDLAESLMISAITHSTALVEQEQAALFIGKNIQFAYSRAIHDNSG